MSRQGRVRGGGGTRFSRHGRNCLSPGAWSRQTRSRSAMSGGSQAMAARQPRARRTLTCAPRTRGLSRATVNALDMLDRVTRNDIIYALQRYIHENVAGPMSLRDRTGEGGSWCMPDGGRKFYLLRSRLASCQRIPLARPRVRRSAFPPESRSGPGLSHFGALRRS